VEACFNRVQLDEIEAVLQLLEAFGTELVPGDQRFRSPMLVAGQWCEAAVQVE
jgi:hypothetical protein